MEQMPRTSGLCDAVWIETIVSKLHRLGIKPLPMQHGDELTWDYSMKHYATCEIEKRDSPSGLLSAGDPASSKTSD